MEWNGKERGVVIVFYLLFIYRIGSIWDGFLRSGNWWVAVGECVCCRMEWNDLYSSSFGA